MTHPLAPMPREAVDRTLRPFGQGFTLPPEAYVSDDVFGWERKHFFEGSWVCVGRGADLPTAGDRRAVTIGSEGVLLVRGESGALRGYFNACRHRGHELLEPGACTSGKVIVCPYHAWTYGLDGALRGAPRFTDVEGFDKRDYPLIDARVEEWHGWVFVNASGDAPPLGAHLADLDGFMGAYEPERLVAAARHDYVIKSNWKIITENYHECYHCPQIHPELCQVTPPDSGDNMIPRGAWSGGSMDLMAHAETMSLTGESFAPPLRGLDAEQRRQVLYFGLFPNLLVSLHPDYVMTHRIEPLSCRESFVECEWLFAPEAVERQGFDPSFASDFWDITNKQDWAAYEAVQRGVGSRGYRQGPLNPAEDAVHQFVTMVARGYSGQPLVADVAQSTP